MKTLFHSKLPIFVSQILALLLIPVCMWAQKNDISKLKNDKEVEKFILKSGFYKERYSWSEEKIKFELINVEDFYGEPLQTKIIDSLRIKKNWFISDIDNNGLDDLICYGRFYPHAYNELIVVFGLPNNKFQYQFVHNEFDDMNRIMNKFFIFSIKGKHNENLLVLLELGVVNKKDIIILSDTLTYRFNTFLNYNPYPSHKAFSKIVFEIQGGGYRSSKFKLEIDSLNNIRFNALENYTMTIKGKKITLKGNYQRKLSFKETKNLYNLIKYTDLKRLKNFYSGEKFYPKIDFKFISPSFNKHIVDLGLFGETYNLKAIYNLIYSFRVSNHWKKIK